MIKESKKIKETTMRDSPLRPADGGAQGTVTKMGGKYGLGNKKPFEPTDSTRRTLFLFADRPRVFSRAYNLSRKTRRDYQAAFAILRCAVRYAGGIA